MKKATKTPAPKRPVFESAIVGPTMWSHGIALPLKDGKRALCFCGKVVKLKEWSEHQRKAGA